jgi:hypothetical protein
MAAVRRWILCCVVVGAALCIGPPGCGDVPTSKETATTSDDDGSGDTDGGDFPPDLPSKSPMGPTPPPEVDANCEWDRRISRCGVGAELQQDCSIPCVLPMPCPRVLCDTYPLDSPECHWVTNPEALECVFEHVASGAAFGFALDQTGSEGFAYGEIIHEYALLGDDRAVRHSRSMGWTNHETGRLLGKQEVWWGDVDREAVATCRDLPENEERFNCVRSVLRLHSCPRSIKTPLCSADE